MMDVGAAIGGIAINLVSSGILKAGSIPFAKVARLHRLQQSLKSARSQNRAVEQAFLDFQHIFARDVSGLNVDHVAFFHELERSGLVQCIAETSVLDESTDEIRTAFNGLYAKFLENDVDRSNEIFDKLVNVFRWSITAALGAGELEFYVNASQKRILKKIEYIAECVKSLQYQDNSIKMEEIGTLTQKLSKSIQLRHRNINVETNKGPRQIEIKRLYIPSRLKLSADDESLKLISDLELKAEVRIGPRGALASVSSAAIDITTASYGEFRKGMSRAVILGDPGGGKTTLCQFMCYELAGVSASSLAHPDIESDRSLNKLPLRIVLRSYEKSRNENPQLDILDYIVRDIKQFCNIDENLIRAAVVHNLQYGGALLAFDGLDEILDRSKRREFVELVDGFANRFPFCPVIVTSRKVNYEDAPLPPEFEEYTLDSFTDYEVRLFTEKFLKVINQNPSKADDVKVQSGRFVSQTERTAVDLRRNPLMLGLMVWLFYMKNDVPSNRPEIYKECALLMFEKWDQNRGILANIPADFDLLHLFGELAASIYGDANAEDGVDRDWLRTKIFAFFADQYSDKARARQSANLLVDFVTGRSWVMSEVGDRVYRFTHRTFLEFFFARHVEEKCDTIKELFSRLRPQIETGQWDVVSHLALQLKSYRNPRRVKEAVNQLTALMEKKNNLKRRKANMFFAARALEYLPAPESDLTQLINSIVGEMHDLARAGESDAVSVLKMMTFSSIERRSHICECVSNSVANLFSTTDASVATVLSRVADAELYYRHLPFPDDEDGSELWSSVRQRIRENAKSYIVQRSLENEIFGHLSMRWYGINVHQIVRKFGIRGITVGIDGPMPDVDRIIRFMFTSLGGADFSGIPNFVGAEEFVKECGRLWPSREAFSLIISANVHRRSAIFPEKFIRASLNATKSNHDIFFGGLYLVMAITEIVEAMVENFPGVIELKASDRAWPRRPEFARSRIAESGRRVLGRTGPRRQFWDEWCQKETHVLNIEFLDARSNRGT